MTAHQNTRLYLAPSSAANNAATSMLLDNDAPEHSADAALGRAEWTVYDLLLRCDVPNCIGTLAVMGYLTLAATEAAVAGLVASGLAWREGNLCGLVDAG